MDVVRMDKLVLMEALRKMEPTLREVHREQRGETLYLHMAPPIQITDLGHLNRLLGKICGALARFGKPDTLSFREEYGVVFLGRINWARIVISVYPADWIAEQKVAINPCPAEPAAISVTDLAA